MAKDDQGLVVVKGDTVTIIAMGMSVTGRVTYAEHYDDWDLELTDCNIPGGYSHWKQYFDKGYISQVNGEAVKVLRK